jgi:hypothetical protein
MLDIQSPYHLNDIQIFESEMKINIDLHSYKLATENLPISMEVTFRKRESSNTHMRGEMLMSVEHQIPHERIKGDRKKPKNVVYLRCSLRGQVTAIFTKEIDEKEREYLLKVNSVSLIYAEVRSHFMNLTATSPVGKVILPTISPYFVVDSYEPEEASRALASKPQECDRGTD